MYAELFLTPSRHIVNKKGKNYFALAPFEFSDGTINIRRDSRVHSREKCFDDSGRERPKRIERYHLVRDYFFSCGQRNSDNSLGDLSFLMIIIQSEKITIIYSRSAAINDKRQ